MSDTQSPSALPDEEVWLFSIPALDATGEPDLVRPAAIGSSKLALSRPCILFSRLNPRIPRVWDVSTLPQGRLSLASTEFVPFVIDDASRLDSGYLVWFLKSNRFVAHARAGARAATKSRERVKKEHLLEMQIPLPSLIAQRRIAAVLDRADAIRRKRGESLRLLDELLRSAFLEMFGDPVRNEQGWAATPLEAIAHIVSGVTKGRNISDATVAAVPYLRVANVQDGYLDLTEVKTIDATASEVARFRLQRGDILLTEGGDPDQLGRGAVWREEVPECIHQNHVFRVRLRDPAFVPEFVSALLGSAYGKRYFLRAAKQTTGIASINRTQLGGFPVLQVPIDLQKRYAAVLAEVRHLDARLLAASKVASDLFDSLAQCAFEEGGPPPARRAV